MRTLLFVVILGLLTPGHSLPVNAVTELPVAKAEEDVLREAVTDGFIVGYAFPTTATSELPRSSSNETTTSQLPYGQSPTDEAEEEGSTTTSSDESDPIEASGIFEGSADVYTSPPWEVTSSHVPTITSTVHSTTEADTLLTSDSSITTQGYSPSSESVTDPSTTISVTLTPTHAVTEEHDVTDSTTSSAALPTSTPMGTSTVAAAVSNHIVPILFNEVEVSRPASEEELEENIISENRLPGLSAVAIDDSNNISKQEDRKSSSWMIITAFVVGAIAMVVVLVAIATRHRWRGAPKQMPNTDESKANGSNQQRELEMETFLEKGTPKEDQHTEEYTVIPLNELPEKQPLQ